MHFLTPLAVLLSASLLNAQTIDPNSVDLATREYWCTQQQSSCPLICLQLKGSAAGVISNTCDADTLAYTCVCANGQSPNLNEYSLTIPYFECTFFNTQCVNACGAGNNGCAAACVDDHPCGAQSPKRYNITSTSSVANPLPATPRPGVTGSVRPAVTTGTGAAAAATSASRQSLNGNNGNAAGALVVELGRVVGGAVLAAGLVGGFAFAV